MTVTTSGFVQLISCSVASVQNIDTIYIGNIRCTDTARCLPSQKAA